MSESDRECVCKPATPEQCQCQYADWPAPENIHYKCDFCAKRPVARELIVHTMPWAICLRCWDFHHLSIEIIQKRHQEEE